MKLSLAFRHEAGALPDLADIAILEKAGLDALWVSEAYGFDAVSLLGFLAAKTQHLRIGSGILPTSTRSPALIAMTAAGLDHVSNGRFALGLGASGPQVIEGFHGIPYDQPIARTREVIEICRSVWRRELLTHEGIHTIPPPKGVGAGFAKPLKLSTHPVRAAIPIYVAALGERSVSMAAEVADGWMPMFFVPELAGGLWGTALRTGFSRRSAGRGDLEIVAAVAVAIGDDVVGYRDDLRTSVALYVGGMGARDNNFYNMLLQRYGWEKKARLIQDLYLQGKRMEAAAAVPDDFLEKISIIGPEGYVKERLATFRSAGATELQITPVGGGRVRLIEQLRELIDS